MGSGKDGGKGADWRTYARYAALTDDELARQCEVQVFRAKGPGGQGVNTTDSAVRMVHVPTGIAVTSRESRSQHQNRRVCLEKLKRIFERRAKPPKHRIKTKVPRAVRERRLSDKRHRSERKQMRRNVSWE